MKTYLALFLVLFACHGEPSHSVGSTVIQPAATFIATAGYTADAGYAATAGTATFATTAGYTADAGYAATAAAINGVTVSGTPEPGMHLVSTSATAAVWEFPPFLPSSIPNLALWVRADVGITVVTGVSVWADQSGNGHNLIQATTGNQPTYLLTGGPTGGPALGFTAANVQNMKATYTEVQPVERYVVGKFGTTASGMTMFDGAAGGNSARLLQNSSSNWGIAAGSTLNLTGPSYTSGLWYAMGGSFNGASSAVGQNGVFNTGTTGTAATVGGVYLGVFGDGASAPLTGNIVEVVDYEGTLTTVQRAQLESYFHAQWGT